jgi:hypothetical protein
MRGDCGVDDEGQVSYGCGTVSSGCLVKGIRAIVMEFIGSGDQDCGAVRLVWNANYTGSDGR